MKKLFLLICTICSIASVHADAEMPTLYSDSTIPMLISVQDDMPMMCTMDYNPVCGVNGTTYGNACGA